MYSTDFYLVWIIQLEFSKMEVSSSLKIIILMDFIYVIFFTFF